MSTPTMKVKDAIDIFGEAQNNILQQMKAYNEKRRKIKEGMQKEIDVKEAEIVALRKVKNSSSGDKFLNAQQRKELKKQTELLQKRLLNFDKDTELQGKQMQKAADGISAELVQLKKIDQDSLAPLSVLQKLYSFVATSEEVFSKDDKNRVIGKLKFKGFDPDKPYATTKVDLPEGFKKHGWPPESSKDPDRFQDPVLKGYKKAKANDKNNNLGKNQGKAISWAKQDTDDDKKDKKTNDRDSKNKNQNEWQSFFNQEDVAKFSKETALDKKLGSIPNVTPQEFKKHFESMGGKISAMESTPNQKIFSVTKGAGEDTYFVGRYVATGENDKKIVELKHVPSNDKDPENPRPGKIDIVLHDPAMKDDSLFMMVVAAKDALDKMGKSEFHIENCKDKPEIALKLFLIGKSLGLDPIFKDGMSYGSDTQTFQSILKPEPDILMRVKGGDPKDKELKLSDVYQRAKDAKSPEEVLKLIKSLERKGPEVALTATAGAAVKASVSSSTGAPKATHGVTAQDLADKTLKSTPPSTPLPPPPPPPPPPPLGGPPPSSGTKRKFGRS